MYCNVCHKYRNFKKTKISYIFLKNLVFVLYTQSAIMNIKKYLMKKNQLKC